MFRARYIILKTRMRKKKIKWKEKTISMHYPFTNMDEDRKLNNYLERRTRYR